MSDTSETPQAITATAAQQAILNLLHRSDERFSIQSCALSPKGDYWIIAANSEDYVVHGRLDRCHVGVGAYFVDTITGAIEIVGSGAGWQLHLQDKYDLLAAGGMQYVIFPTFDFDDKHAVINLRQQLECSLVSVRDMLTEGQGWLTGNLRVLIAAKKLLDERGISTTVKLVDALGEAAPIGEQVWHWEALKKVLQGSPTR